VSGKPPALSNDTKAAVAGAAQSDPTGSHVPRQDAGSKVGSAAAAEGDKKVKSEKECTDNP
jgi:valyl-tRNA synthetase